MKKILIVEDHLLAQHMLCLFLHSYAVQCTSVETAEAALLAVDTEQYDLIFIDLGLPDYTGFELAEALRGLGVACPLVGLTSQLEEAYQNHPEGALFTSIVEKPLTEHSQVEGRSFKAFMAMVV